MPIKNFNLILILAFLFSMNCNSQSEVFLDENNKQITSIEYFSKCKSFVLICNKKEVDSVNVNYITKPFTFGQLDQIENKQLKTLLETQSNQKFDNTKTIIISYRNSINGLAHINKIRAKNNEAKRYKNYTFKPIQKKSFLSSQKQFDYTQKKCRKQFRKENVEPLYVFHKNNDYNYRPKHFNWIQSPINLENVFKTEVLDISMKIIIKPNGEYFISNYAIPTKIFKKIISDKNWQKAKLQLQRSISSNSINGIGYFNEIKSQNKKGLKFMIIPKTKNGRKIIPPKDVIVIANEDEKQYYYSLYAKCF